MKFEEKRRPLIFSVFVFCFLKLWNTFCWFNYIGRISWTSHTSHKHKRYRIVVFDCCCQRKNGASFRNKDWGKYWIFLHRCTYQGCNRNNFNGNHLWRFVFEFVDFWKNNFLNEQILGDAKFTSFTLNPDPDTAKELFESWVRICLFVSFISPCCVFFVFVVLESNFIRQSSRS